MTREMTRETTSGTAGATTRLGAEARDRALGRLDGWIYDAEADAISHEFRFRDFSEAFAFMTRVALLAQQADHHPNWSNSYNRVSVTLRTHDAGGLTARDIALAEGIDRLFG